MVAEKLIWVGGDVHLYQDQVKIFEEQYHREILENTATVRFNPEVTDFFAITADDIQINDYASQPPLKFPPAAV